MRRYKKDNTAFIAIENNRIIAQNRTAKGFAEDLPDIGKSNIWYGRKFSNTNTFTHLVDGRVFYFYKITV